MLDMELITNRKGVVRMNKLYIVQFYMKGKPCLTRSFWNESEAIDYMNNPMYKPFWKFSEVKDNVIHKIWKAV